MTRRGDRPEAGFVVEPTPGNPHPGVTSMDAMLKRFAEQAPVAVMARLGMQRAISAEWVNEVFEQHSDAQYTRELLFSTVVDLMSLVALGLRPSLHAAAQKARDLPWCAAALSGSRP